MTILITGICGFVGSAIARGLREEWPSAKICGIDSLIRRGSETNVTKLEAIGVGVQIGDIRNRDDLEGLPKADWVIDCAANPSVLAGVDRKTSPRELLDHNLVGTIELLELCRARESGFILLSTSRVYSIPPLARMDVRIENHAFVPEPASFGTGMSEQGVAEDFSTVPPLSLYGNSKLCSELLALEYGETFGFPVWINRCGVLAGAGQFGRADQGIFSFWLHSWTQKRPLKYIGFGGMGHQVRDCLHPGDIVPLLIKQIQDPQRQVPKIQNVSGGLQQSMSLANLSAWCAERIGSHGVQPDLAPRPFDIPWLVLDSGLVSKNWDWSPRTPLESVLEEISKHARENPGWLEMTA